MTDQSSTGPDGSGDDGLGTDLESDGAGTRSNEEVEEKAEHGDEQRSGGHGPMVSDAAIDWTALGAPTDPEPTDGTAPAP